MSMSAIKIKEEHPLSDDAHLENETEFFNEEFDTTKKSTGPVLLNSDRDLATKSEIKSETPFIKYLTLEIKTEIAGCSSNREREQSLLSDFGSQNKEEYLPKDPVITTETCDSEREIHNEIQIKEEPFWLETETLSKCKDIKDEDLPPVKPSRLCMEAASAVSSDGSPLPPAEVPGRNMKLSEKDNLESECLKNVTEMPTAEEHAFSKQPGKCIDGGEMSIGNLYMHKKDLTPKGKRSYICKICAKGFTRVSYLKIHYLIHEGKKPYQCKTCHKNFTQVSHLRSHCLTHEGKKKQQCKSCDKSFTHLSTLKRHNLIHEGKKPHQCKTCDKSFTQLANLKAHNLIHEGKKPHQCKTCDKSFTRMSHLKSHNLIHEGKKPHQCKTCDKSFTHLSTLKRHNLVHEGRKPYKCKTCDKNFTHLSTLKNHNMVHVGKKSHQCKTCDKTFAYLSSLRKHNLIHKGKK